jgi:hypothetical protein
MRFIVITLTFLLIASCTTTQTERVIIGGRSSGESIRKKLLIKTPLGSSAADVALFINHHLQHRGGRIPALDSNGRLDLTASGEKSMGLYEYESIPDFPLNFLKPRPLGDFEFYIGASQRG